MATEVILPKMGMAMEEGSVATWAVEEGQHIDVGQILCEFTTDKVDTEIEAEQSGYVARLLVSEGETVSVGTPIAILVEDEDELTQYIEAGATDRAGTNVQSSDTTGVEIPDRKSGAEDGGEPSTTAAVSDEVQPRTGSGVEEEAPRAAFATPAARRVAREHGIRLERLEGTGSGGIVTADDVEAAADSGKAESQKQAARISKVVARRMTESFSAPHFYLSAELQATRLLEAVESLRSEQGVDATITDLLLHVTSRTLSDHEDMNALWVDGGIVESSRVNAGFAVDTPRGLLVPVVKDAGSLGIHELVKRRRELTSSARSGNLALADLEDGTWTLTNLGMFHIDSFQAILNPPQAMILATGHVKERPWVVEGRVVAQPTLILTLSGDHRLVDGATAARFLDDLKVNLESLDR